MCRSELERLESREGMRETTPLTERGTSLLAAFEFAFDVTRTHITHRLSAWEKVKDSIILYVENSRKGRLCRARYKPYSAVINANSSFSLFSPFSIRVLWAPPAYSGR